MRAAILYDVGSELDVVDDLKLRDVRAGEVRVRLEASGVCHSDVSFANGTLGAVLPAALGHEGAGVVEEVGPGVTSVSAGDHVILAWVPPCGSCRLCLGGQPYLCASRSASTAEAPLSRGGQLIQSALGVGSFAEATIVPAHAAIRIASDIPFDVASLVGCGVMTGIGAAVNTAKVAPGSSVLVIGCGGVGLNVVQGARLCGAGEIVAMDPVESKRDAARIFGASDAIDADGLAEARARTPGGLGFDYVFEVVGRSATIRTAWDATRRGGTTVIVGAGSPRDQVTFSAAELFGSARTLLGCVYGSADVRSDFDRVLRLWRAGRIDLETLISRRIGLDDVNDAFSAMQAGDVLRSVICY